MSRKNLVLRDVTKQYKPGKPVFRNLSMEFKPGEAALLTGPNGSGKTTLLRLLSVSAFPTSGTVTYGGIDIHQSPYVYLKHVGLVYDDESMPLYLTAIEILEWILRSRNCWNSESPGRIDRLFDLLDLSEARSEQLGTYSTGMRKKVQIASALITDPQLLILDEPLRGLDQSSRATVLTLIRERVQSGAICLMATHGAEEIATGFDHRLTFPITSGRPLT